ncbi:hypothetical protein BDC45DRAFT_533775 [Circinella umbellata]|nr:hypothetical protein BDC45DRAFT_533775 [Circinella umbellata]
MTISVYVLGSTSRLSSCDNHTLLSFARFTPLSVINTCLCFASGTKNFPSLYVAYHINNSKDVYFVTQKINQMILPAYVLIHIRKLMGGYDLHHKIQNSISSQRKKDQSECWSGVLSVSMGPLVIMEGIVDWWSTSNHNIVCSFIMLEAYNWTNAAVILSGDMTKFVLE